MSGGPSGSGGTRRGRLAAGLTAVLAGFATMCLELTAVRLLAPFFGDSAYVWTNVIGVILVALAAGSFLGGRMADRGGGPPVLAMLLLAGAGLAAAAPLLLPGLAGWLMDPTLPLDAAFGAMVQGSLAAGCVLFGPPVLLLGAVPPFLIKIHAGGDPARVGRAGGAIYALGTLGGLAGTFLPTHVLVPGLGSRMTVVVSALVLLAAGLVMVSVGGLRPRWRTAVPAAVAWTLTAPFLLPVSAKPLAGDGKVLAERESRYQYLRVVERPRADGKRTRALEINEGLDSFHSFTVVGSVLTGHYYDSFALLPAFLPPGERFRMVSLGGAAGTVQRIFRAVYGDRCEALGVELDPVTVELGRDHMELPAGEETVICDARVFVALDGGSFDLVVADTYRHQIYIPAHLASREFVERLRDRLTPGGIAAFNVGGFSFASPVVVAVANTVASVFGEAVILKVRHARNFLVLGRKGDPVDPARLRDGAGLPAALAETARFASLPGSWCRVPHDPRNPVLRDDRPFLDRMHERMYSGAER